MVEDQQIIGSTNVNTVLTFNAKSVQPELLERLLIGRKELVDILYKKIVGIITDKNNVQVQLIGKRGMGKSHITAVIFNRLKEQRLNNEIKIAYLSEEEYGVASYLDFLIRIIHAFMRWYPDTKESLELEFDTLREIHVNNQEKFAESIILKYTETVPLLILVENLDDIFDAIKIPGQSKLRAFLYSNPHVNILATSQALSQDMGKEDKPFFGFFETIYLKNLEFEDALALLRELAIIEGQTEVSEFLHGKGIGYVKAIQQLVKGNHRLLVRFYEFLKVDTMARLSTMFMKTVNELKPYFESFIRPLPPLEQKIIYYLAFQRIPKRGSDIGKDCFIDSNSLSKKLSELQRRNLIDVLPDPKSKRDKLYEISDPMLRIALASGENKNGFSGMVVDWIALWYNTAELKAQIEKYKNNIDELEIRRLALSRKAEILHIYYGEDELYDEIGDCIFGKNLSEAKQILENIPIEKQNELFNWYKGLIFHTEGDFKNAIEVFINILPLNRRNPDLLFMLGSSFLSEKDYSNAIKYLKDSVKYAEENDKKENCMMMLSYAYTYNQETEKSISTYKSVLELNPSNIYARNFIGLEYYTKGNYIESIKHLESALIIDKYNDLSLEYLFCNYQELGNFLLALDYYLRLFLTLIEQKEIKKIDKFQNENLVNFIIALIKHKETTKEELTRILNKLQSFNKENPEYSINIYILEVFYKVKFLNERSALLSLDKELRTFFENELKI